MIQYFYKLSSFWIHSFKYYSIIVCCCCFNMTWFTFLTCSQWHYATPWTIETSLPALKNIDGEINFWSISVSTFLIVLCPPKCSFFVGSYTRASGTGTYVSWNLICVPFTKPCSFSWGCTDLKDNKLFLYWKALSYCQVLCPGGKSIQIMCGFFCVHPARMPFYELRKYDIKIMVIRDHSNDSAACIAKRKDKRNPERSRKSNSLILD